MPPGQTKISAYRTMATTAKEQLSTPQYLCALWARNNLSYDLIDDPMFRHQFGVCIPIGFNRMKLSEEMHSLAELINKRILAKVGKCMATIAVDGWTNTRHHKMYNIVLIYAGEAYFIDSVETWCVYFLFIVRSCDNGCQVEWCC